MLPNIKLLQVLREDQIGRIHRASLQVLEEVGIGVPHQELLARCRDAGCMVDFDHQRVRFPVHLVEEALRRAPSRFTWYARNPKYNMDMGGDNVYFSPVITTIHVIEADGNRRPATLQDADDLTRLSDGLEYLDLAPCVVTPTDVLPHAMHAHMMRSMFTNASKSFKGRINDRTVAQDCIRMAEVVAGGSEELRRRPLIIGLINTYSPLSHLTNQLDGMMEYVRAGLPVCVTPEVQAGLTGPVTLAGTLVQQNAEILGTFALIHLLSPGHPMMYGTVSSLFDMRKMMLAYACPEALLIQVASAQLAKFYNLPCRGTGGVSDSNAVDLQSAYEGAMQTQVAALAGINYLHHGAGGLENSLAVSYEKLVAENEIIGEIRRMMRGIEVDETTLAVEVIEEVGPGGSFLETDHTIKRFRTEHFMPELAIRDKYETWKAAGGRTMLEAAGEKARKILAEHRPDPPLPEDVAQELTAMVKTIEKREPK